MGMNLGWSRPNWKAASMRLQFHHRRRHGDVLSSSVFQRRDSELYSGGSGQPQSTLRHCLTVG